MAGFGPNRIALSDDKTLTVGTKMKFQPTAFAFQTVDSVSISWCDLFQRSRRLR
jgi:hypothetical protein